MNQWKSLSIKPGVFGTQGGKELCLGLCDPGVRVNRSFPCPSGGQKEPSLAESWVSALPCRRKDSFCALVRPQLLAPKALGQKLPCCPVSGCASTIVRMPASGAKKYLSIEGLFFFSKHLTCSVLSFYQKYLKVLGSLSKTMLKGSNSTSHGPSRGCPLEGPSRKCLLRQLLLSTMQKGRV